MVSRTENGSTQSEMCSPPRLHGQPGQWPDASNLAACHCFALLPETSCEGQNRLLDRAVVVGTAERPSLGFFEGLW
jgi:hypothetical protein